MKTKPVRRFLRFHTVVEAKADLNKIEAALRSGRLRATGNWTPGEILSHVAAWIEYGYDGYPIKPLPLLMQWVMRRLLRKLLRDGMKPGVRIPGIKGGTTGAEKIETADAIEKLRRALERLASGEPGTFHSPAFGKISEQDRVALMLRHAELHLSFLAID